MARGEPASITTAPPPRVSSVGTAGLSLFALDGVGAVLHVVGCTVALLAPRDHWKPPPSCDEQSVSRRTWGSAEH